MNDASEDFEDGDADILTFEVSDAALEAAASRDYSGRGLLVSQLADRQHFVSVLRQRLARTPVRADDALERAAPGRRWSAPFRRRVCR